MKGTVKRIISGIAAVAVMLTVTAAFVGCGDVQIPIDTDKKYVVYYDNLGNSYNIVADEEETVYYDYQEDTIYEFQYEVFYSQNDEPTGERGTFYKIDASKPGKHSLRVVTRIHGGGENWTYLRVVVEEKPRLTPEISFDPNGAIDYVANEKYVYEYDPSKSQKHPILKLFYNGKPLEIRYDGAYTADDLENGDNLAVYDVSIGTYRFNYVVDDEDYVNDDDKGIYEKVIVRVIVEYVEV